MAVEMAYAWVINLTIIVDSVSNHALSDVLAIFDREGVRNSWCHGQGYHEAKKVRLMI